MDQETEWKPFFARRNSAAEEEFTRLHDGVPAWLNESLWEWLSQSVSIFRSTRDRGYWDPNEATLRRLERTLQISTTWQGDGREYSDRLAGLRLFRTAVYKHPDKFLSAVDYQLSQLSPTDGGCTSLETILTESSSAWRVGIVAGKPGLVERIDATVQSAAEDLALKGDQAGRLLADAWRHAFSLARDPSAAYRCAVRAVEAAAGPIISPRDSTRTLGKMISAFRDKPEKWSFSFTVDSTVSPKDVLLSMLQVLWTNEYSRHVDADTQAPLHVSQEEAESAVALALTLVTWFSSGAVRPVQ